MAVPRAIAEANDRRYAMLSPSFALKTRTYLTYPAYLKLGRYVLCAREIGTDLTILYC